MKERRRPKLLLALLRIAFITFFTTLLSFALALLVGIVVLAIANALRGGGISMELAYRRVAFPFAMFMLVVGLVGATVFEVRH